jgi:CRP/FNR family transcriptional regulator, cyclic AMP receptor protein
MDTSWWPESRKGDLVGYLTDAEHERLLAAMEPCTAAEGDLVFQKGSPSRSLLLVEQGRLEVFDESVGETVVLGAVGPGGVVGEVGFVDGRPRTHHVRARGSCHLRRLTRDRLLELVKDDPQLFAKLTIALAQLVAQRFRAAVDELEPVRAFAASLREPEDLEAGDAFDEIDSPLPAADPAEPDPAEAARLLKDVARKGRKKKSSAAV